MFSKSYYPFILSGILSGALCSFLFAKDAGDMVAGAGAVSVTVSPKLTHVTESSAKPGVARATEEDDKLGDSSFVVGAGGAALTFSKPPLASPAGGAGRGHGGRPLLGGLPRRSYAGIGHGGGISVDAWNALREPHPYSSPSLVSRPLGVAAAASLTVPSALTVTRHSGPRPPHPVPVSDALLPVGSYLESLGASAGAVPPPPASTAVAATTDHAIHAEEEV